MQHTIDICDDSAVVKDKLQEEKEYIEKLHGDKSREVAAYIGRAILSYQDKGCIMAPYNFKYVRNFFCKNFMNY
ncbi:hypothetical protein E2562_026789 [Oryza meyeriana var. granulata]|uniref:Uncharacterized protein n=1 Tax=Oryza meyeriana var. granulata TaxID=110450 RepID=A0A6G1CT94_9ORYZ|nr:hypothetical protein E2562_026789 [Oryza meyeriana var. granulata]